MRLATYARTSSTGDGQDSLDAQAQACASFASRHGHVIASSHRDESISGRLPVDQRPALLTALLAIETGEADGLIVHRIDRLARELHVQEAALARLWGLRADVAVFEATHGEIPRDDPNDPYRTFLRLVLGAAAQLERGLVTARLQGGRRRKIAAGGWAGGHRLHRRYGYRAVDGEYVPVEVEQHAIIFMAAELAGGASYRAIVRALECGAYAPPSSATWHPATVRKILVREGYAPTKAVNAA